MDGGFQEALGNAGLQYEQHAVGPTGGSASPGVASSGALRFEWGTELIQDVHTMFGLDEEAPPRQLSVLIPPLVW